MTDFLKVSQFGMMYKLLTESLGEELLMSYLGDFHAKTLVQQEKAQELTESGQECGKKWQGSFTKYDQNMSLWKTPQCSFIEDSVWFSDSWPRWGLMRHGECWEHQTLELNITEREFGLLPDGVSFFHTPTTGKDGGSNSRKALKKRKEAIWPTPTTPSGGGNAGGSGAHKNAIKNGTYIPSSINPNLYEWLMGWPQGWTDLKPLETDKYLKWLELHGNC
jgi:DNA (cytosine-5)-methyltransferase 1